VDVLRSFLSQIDHMEKDDLARAISRLAPLLADLDAAEAGFRRVGYQ
jgi:hypothetical protein